MAERESKQSADEVFERMGLSKGFHLNPEDVLEIIEGAKENSRLEQARPSIDAEALDFRITF